jgi:hypothetical protein
MLSGSYLLSSRDVQIWASCSIGVTVEFMSRRIVQQVQLPVILNSYIMGRLGYSNVAYCEGRNVKTKEGLDRNMMNGPPKSICKKPPSSQALSFFPVSVLGSRLKPRQHLGAIYGYK